MSPRQRQPADPRHAEFKAVLAEYFTAECGDEFAMPWSDRDAGALGSFLRANPKLTRDGFGRLLQHRLDSEDHAPGEPVYLWIPAITRYVRGPLNKFKQPKERSNHAGNGADARNQHAASATAAALARLRGVADDPHR